VIADHLLSPKSAVAVLRRLARERRATGRNN
jgi:hypothetical protein